MISDRGIKALIKVVVAVALLAVVFCTCVDVVNIEGYEVGIVHKWVGGVQAEPLQQGMHTVFFGKVHKVNIGTRKMSFEPKYAANDTADNVMKMSDFAPIVVACGKDGGQKATILLNLVYHLDPLGAVAVYKEGIIETYPYSVMKRTVIEVVNDCARPKEALEIFSGAGFNELKVQIDKELKAHPVFSNRKIVVENATLIQVDLDPAYEKEIEAKQLAKQKQLRAMAETLAATEESKKVAATALSIVSQRTAEANAKQIEVETAAKADASKVTIAAQADAEMVTIKAKAAAAQVEVAAEAEAKAAKLKGEGMRDGMIAQSEGELAMGKAKATVAELLKKAQYEGPEGLRKAQVETTTALAEKLHGILAGVKILPEKAMMVLMDDAKVPVTLQAPAEAAK